MRRHNALNAIISNLRPSTIVEIGTHKGTRTLQMITQALRHVRRVEYTGFDIFEFGDAMFHEDALNTDGIAVEARAHNMLRRLSLASHGRVCGSLIVGDTRQTLAGRNIAADLVFIDGDHRADVIRSDYGALQMSRVVVFDAFYVRNRGGEVPSPLLYGSNALVYELMMDDQERGVKVEILPAEDRNILGGRIKLVVVSRQ